MRALLRSLFPPLSDYELRIFAWGMLTFGVIVVVLTFIWWVAGWL